MPYIGKEPEHGNYQLLDALTLPSGVFDGSRTVFNLTADGVAVYPTSPTTLIISLGGVLQEPNSSYTVSGNQITFTTAPATSTTFFGVSLGDTLDIGTPSDGSVTVAKMADNSVDSDQYVDGSIDNVHLADGAVDTAEIADDAVTYAKMQNLGTADRVLGSVSTGVIGEVQIVPDMLATNAVTNVKVATGIDAIKLADGTVTNTELQYINSLSSNAQTQLTSKASLASPVFTDSIRITAASAPGSPAEGQIYYNTTDKKAYMWNGTAWKALNNAARSSATGGDTISTYTSGGTTYRYHIFTETGTFTPTTAFNIEYLVIAGGGGGGDGWRGGGGGAGGYRNSVPGEKTGGGGNAESAVGVVAQAYTITVGAGGAGGAGASGTSGGASSIAGSGFTTITATGGGGGGGNYVSDADGATGGSGGGGGGHASDAGEGGTVSSPTQGYAGGNGLTSSTYALGGGGGGAGGAGHNASPGTGATDGDGGVGLSSSITGSAVRRGGGGGGGGYETNTNAAVGVDGGGNGGVGNPASPGAVAGTANTGGGGGGQSTTADGAAGGSGIVIIRYVYEESDGYVASESVDEENLNISNAGSNGEFLSKQSGNAGGLTWAAASGLRGIIVLNPQGIDNTSTGALGVIAPHPWVGCRPTGAGNDGSAYFTGSAPSDFTTLESAKLVCLGVEGSTNVRLGTNTCKIAAHSEINTTHSNSMATANYAITTNEIMHIDISSLFTNLAANDSFAFNIRRNGSHGDDTVTTFYIYSAILEYS